MNKEILKKKISIGHNGNLDFIKVIEEYEDYIYEVYFGPASWVVPSTRPNDRTINKDYTKIIKEHIKICKDKKYDIKFSLLLNTQCWDGEFRSPQLIQKIIDYMELLELQFDDIVVSDPFIAKILSEIVPDKTFTTSVISALNDVEICVEFLKAFPHFETICVGHKLTYNIEEVKRIKSITGKKIKLLINQGCYYSCPDYTLHSVALAHTAKCFNPMEEGKKLYCDILNSQLNEESWKNLTHQALSPEYIYYYKDVVDVYKISTRIESDIDRIRTIINGYIRGDKSIYSKKLFMGGGRSVNYEIAAIFSLVDYPNDYIEVRNKCLNRCNHCYYCKDLWEKACKKYYSLKMEDRPSKKQLNYRKDKAIMPL